MTPNGSTLSFLIHVLLLLFFAGTQTCRSYAFGAPKPSTTTTSLKPSTLPTKKLIWRHSDSENTYWRRAPNLMANGWVQNGLVVNITHVLDPTLQVEMAPDIMCAKLSTTSRDLLWYRVEDGWYGCHYVRPIMSSSSSSSSLDVLPKITSKDMEEYYYCCFRERQEQQQQQQKQQSTNDNFNMQWPSFGHRYWAKRFAHDLEQSSTSPLTTGFWQLAPVFKDGMVPHKIMELILKKMPFSSGYANFDQYIPAWPLRPMSHPEYSGRVKWWRKKVRDEVEAGGGSNSLSIPPVLLWWFSGLDSHVILDGHDRLLAAYLEGKPIGALSLRQLDVKSVDDEMVQAISKAATIHDRVKRNLLLAAKSSNQQQLQQQLEVDISNRQLLERHVSQLGDRDSHAIGSISAAQWVADVKAALNRTGYDDLDFQEAILHGLEE